MLPIVEDAASPDRCQAIGKKDQCSNKAEPGSKFCKLHCGVSNEMRNYRLELYKHRLDDFVNSSEVLNLREEIGLLRIMVEERMNMVKNPKELILHSGPISDLIAKIERIVISCNKLEKNLGSVLDAQQLLSFAQRIISILTEEINDKEVLSVISNKILACLDPNA